MSELLCNMLASDTRSWSKIQPHAGGTHVDPKIVVCESSAIVAVSYACTRGCLKQTETRPQSESEDFCFGSCMVAGAVGVEGVHE